MEQRIVTTACDIEEALVRIMRHEVGDFLQSVHCTMSLLNSCYQFNKDKKISRLVQNLTCRSTRLRRFIDILQHLHSPWIVSPKVCNIKNLLRLSLDEIAAQYPLLDLGLVEDLGDYEFSLDQSRISLSLEVLLHNACRAAKSTVKVYLSRSPKVNLQIVNDGDYLSPEEFKVSLKGQISFIEGQMGLGLAFVRKVVDYHGGDLQIENMPSGGVSVSLTLSPIH